MVTVEGPAARDGTGRAQVGVKRGPGITVWGCGLRCERPGLIKRESLDLRRDPGRAGLCRRVLKRVLEMLFDHENCCEYLIVWWR